jgi:hypothetical protein
LVAESKAVVAVELPSTVNQLSVDRKFKSTFALRYLACVVTLMFLRQMHTPGGLEIAADS